LEELQNDPVYRLEKIDERIRMINIKKLIKKQIQNHQAILNDNLQPNIKKHC
jgi:hypothetical protein